MASPQCENGYTRIANELLEALCKLHLSGNAMMVLWAVIRKTYGWNKTSDWISGGQLAAMTGLCRSRVCEALALLQGRRIILRDKGLIGIQKDYTTWTDIPIVEHPGWVYVIQAENGLCKIGRSVLDPHRRVKALQDNSPWALELVALVETGDAFQLEKQLHRQFAHKRKQGEWFALTKEDVTNIRNVPDIVAPVTDTRNEALRKSRHTKDSKETIQKILGPPPKPISSQVHPAARILVEITGKCPKKGTYEYNRVVNTITDNPVKLEKWRMVVGEWQMSPYQKTNLRGMLDWFANGIPKYRPQTQDAAPEVKWLDSQS